MKKLFSIFSTITLIIPCFAQANANEYQFLKSSGSVINNIGTVKVSGIAADGTETVLQSWESSPSNFYEGFSSNMNNAIIDQYTGNVYFEVSERINGNPDKYVMKYDYWLIDLNVTVNVEMGYVQNQLVPFNIHYNGFWDIPFNKPEIADFTLTNYDFEIIE